MIVLYILENCFYCNKAIQLLTNNNIKFKKIIIENNNEVKNNYKIQNGMDTFPQIFLRVDSDKFRKIGGYLDLEQFINK
jgi:glutaredoxin